MSIIDTFDNKSEEVIKPSIIAAPVEEFPNTVIITFRPEMIDILKDMCEILEISQMPAVIPIPVYKFTYKGHELGIYVTVPCGPATTALMEEVFVKRRKTFCCSARAVLSTNGRPRGTLLFRSRTAVPPTFFRQPRNRAPVIVWERKYG